MGLPLALMQRKHSASAGAFGWKHKNNRARRNLSPTPARGEDATRWERRGELQPAGTSCWVGREERRSWDAVLPLPCQLRGQLQSQGERCWLTALTLPGHLEDKGQEKEAQPRQ